MSAPTPATHWSPAGYLHPGPVEGCRRCPAGSSRTDREILGTLGWIVTAPAFAYTDHRATIRARRDALANGLRLVLIAVGMVAAAAGHVVTGELVIR